MSRTSKATSRSVFGQQVADFKLLTKFRLSLTVVFSSVMAYLIAADNFSWVRVLVLALGGTLVTGAASALNQVLERDTDKLMVRTADRPLAAGRMTSSTAVLLAGLMSAVGISLLSLLGPVSAFLGTISLILYGFIYTPLKRYSNIAVAVGAVPGALPTMIGVVAAQGDQITWLALFLFSIQFLWQFPHFWSIAWLADEDYKRAGFRLLPGDGNKTPLVGLQSVLYAALLLVLGTIPFMLGHIQPLAYLGLQLLNLMYVYYSWQLYRRVDHAAARRLMFASFFYLPLVLTVLLLNRF